MRRERWTLLSEVIVFRLLVFLTFDLIANLYFRAFQSAVSDPGETTF